MFDIGITYEALTFRARAIDNARYEPGECAYVYVCVI